MNDPIPDLPQLMPAWKELRLIVRQLVIDQRTKERNVPRFLVEIRDSLPSATDADIVRSLNDLEMPSAALKRVIFRWCQRQVASMKEAGD